METAQEPLLHNNEHINLTNAPLPNNPTLHVNNELSIPQEIPHRNQLDIYTRRKKLFKQFDLTISSFADIACNICQK